MPGDRLGPLVVGALFSGWYVVSLALPTPGMRRVLGAAPGLTLVTGSALLFAWLALTGGGARQSAMSTSPGSFFLSREVARVIVDVFFRLFALLTNAVALVAWAVAVTGVTVLLVEQNVRQALTLAHRAVCWRAGEWSSTDPHATCSETGGSSALI